MSCKPAQLPPPAPLLFLKDTDLIPSLFSLLPLKSTPLKLRCRAPCAPAHSRSLAGQGGALQQLQPVLPVPRLPGLLDLPRLLYHAALRGVHRVAAAEGAHHGQLRPGERPPWGTGLQVCRAPRGARTNRKACVFVKGAQSCPGLGDPMDCNPPGSSDHGILQARILEWVAFPFSRESSQPRDQAQVFPNAGGFTSWGTRESLRVDRECV